MALGNLSVVLPPRIHHALNPLQNRKPSFNSSINPITFMRCHPGCCCTLDFGGSIKCPPGLPAPPLQPEHKEEGHNQPGSREEFICDGMLPCTLRTRHCRRPPDRAGGDEPTPHCPHHHGWVSTGPPAGRGCERKSLQPNSFIFCSGEAAASQEWGAGLWAAEPSPAHKDRSTLQDLGLTTGSGWDGEVEMGLGMGIEMGIEVGMGILQSP